jgi:hypothetical protein
MSDILIPGAYWNDNVIDPKAEATPKIKSPPKAFESIAGPLTPEVTLDYLELLPLTPSTIYAPNGSYSTLQLQLVAHFSDSSTQDWTLGPPTGYIQYYYTPFSLEGASVDGNGLLTIYSPYSVDISAHWFHGPEDVSNTITVNTVDVPSDVIAFWRLNGNLLDNTGGGLNGIGSKPITGGLYTSASINFVSDGKLFSAANFISYKQSRIPGLPQVWRSGGAWSFSAWVRIPTFGGYGIDNTSKYLFSFNGVGPMLRVDWQAGTSKWRLRESSYNGVWAGNMPAGVETVIGASVGVECDIPPDDWHHIVVTHELPDRKFYLDGVYQGGSIYSSSAGTNQSNFPSADSCLGGNMFNIATFSPENLSVSAKGMDDVGLWSRGLTAAEVLMIWNGGAGWTWPFN